MRLMPALWLCISKNIFINMNSIMHSAYVYHKSKIWTENQLYTCKEPKSHPRHRPFPSVLVDGPSRT